MKDNLIYTAPWIIPICSPAIKQGAIVANSKQLVEVGPQQKVLQDYPDCTIIELRGILIPPLINGHIHLELSYLKNMVRPAKGETMVEWIEELLQQRQKRSGEDILIGMHNTITDQYNSGVILMADIGNVSGMLPDSIEKYPEIYSIHELLGPTRERVATAIDTLSGCDKSELISPHAPYSTSAQLIIALKKRAAENNQIFSMHLAESVEEIELICHGQGPFRHFLEKRASWQSDMLGDSTYKGAVDYLDTLDVLDDKTLCVHCVHVNEEEIRLLASKKVKICLCPGSNEFLGVGCAPLDKMLSNGILPAIGTDSYASNETLDMWREMQILRRHFPSVAHDTILAMATLGGAISLQRSDSYGTLEKGKAPVFLEIFLDDLENLSQKDIFNLLTLGGRPQKINWITPPAN